jgi:hypothetical protein
MIGNPLIADGETITVDDEMAEHIADYAKLVRDYAEGGMLFVERRVDFSHVVNMPGNFGTSDAVILHPNRLTVIDLKYGRGVKVDAINNPQLALYALGALNDYEALGDYEEVLMVVHQPRLNHVSEWCVPTSELEQFAREARLAAELTTQEPKYVPGEKQCRFCRAKAVCPALREEVREKVGVASLSDFADLAQRPADELAEDMARVELVEGWCKAIRAEVERRLFAGQNVTGWKLVEGRRGNRAWSDEGEAEKILKAARLKREEMYDIKLISPTTAEKLLKDRPATWEKLDAFVTRPDGKASVAPATDKRPAMAVSSADVVRALTAN